MALALDISISSPMDSDRLWTPNPPPQSSGGYFELRDLKQRLQSFYDVSFNRDDGTLKTQNITGIVPVFSDLNAGSWLGIDSSGNPAWLPSPIATSNSPTGVIAMMAAPVSDGKSSFVPAGFPIIPEGFLWCNGQAYSISQYSALYGALGPTFASTTPGFFNVPDYRGRAIIGQNTGKNWLVGSQLGTETVALNSTHINSHGHDSDAFHYLGPGATTMDCVIYPTLAYPQGDGPPGPAKNLGSNHVASVTDFQNFIWQTDSAGLGKGHQNVQPSVAIIFCIKT